MPFLRQSTAQTIRFGPCLDKTDGVTEEIALTLAQADMRLSKDGGAFAQKNATGNATHDSDGWYSTSLDATDVATIGELILNVHQPANMLPVWKRWWVIEEAVYDALFGAAAAGPLQSTVAARTLDVTAAGNAGIDWANVENKGSTVNLSATITNLVNTATTLTNAVSAVTGAVGSVTGSVGSVIGNVGGTVASVVGNVAGNVVGSVGSVLGSVLGSVVGSVGSVLGAVASVTAQVTANITGISGSSIAADKLEQNLVNDLLGVASGTPTIGTMISDITVTVDDQFKGRIITFDDDTTTAALRRQSTDITASTAATNTLIFTNLTTAPVSGDTFVIT